MKRITFLLLSVLVLVSCNSKSEVESHIYTGEALGTTYMVKYTSDREIDFEKSLDSILDTINSSMSTYITKSDISRINRGDSTVKVDKHFVKVFNASDKIFRESNGFFDPTVGVLVNAYGFGPEKPVKQIDSIKLDSLRNLVGFNKIRLNEDGRVLKDNPAIYLDFNAIAKGYTIDVIAEYLEANNVENYLIELGGELRASGKNLKSDSDWVVGIDNISGTRKPDNFQAKVTLSNAAMATSGNYRKYRTDSLTGQKFVHTINPITGKAERSNLLSASVIAENCMLADGYATAFMALGFDKTRKLLKDLDGVEAYILYSSKEGQIKVFNTSGFQKLILE
ncbi:FAD:protein FMN transferase [Christiangramia forsetii]|nr:FAD:protein FMN transferase [Christiangramia forsetii]